MFEDVEVRAGLGFEADGRFLGERAKSGISVDVAIHAESGHTHQDYRDQIELQQPGEHQDRPLTRLSSVVFRRPGSCY